MAKNLQKLTERLGSSLGKGSKQARSSSSSKPIPRLIEGSAPVPKLSVSIYETDMKILNDRQTDLLNHGVRTPNRSAILRAAIRVLDENKHTMIGEQSLLDIFYATYDVMIREDDGRSVRKLNRLQAEGHAAPSAPKKAPAKPAKKKPEKAKPKK